MEFYKYEPNSYSILLEESIESLNIKEGHIVVDATVNRGGHSIEIAKKKIGKSGVLICIDLDSNALNETKIFLEKILKRIYKNFYINDNFRNIKETLKNLKIKNIDALFADLGVSSEEIDISGRGFTFQKMNHYS